MSYIAFELDALNVCPQVGAACGLTAAEAAHGLLQLWAWCFRTEQASVTDTHLRGFFGGADAGKALEAFGFLGASADGWRVKGAERYLRVKEAKRRGGKKAAANGNLRRGKRRGAGGGAGAPLPGLPPGPLQESPSSAPALTPSTEHRAPNLETPAPASREPVDRKGPLIGRLKASFRRQTGSDYVFTDADGGALKNLMGKATDDEIDRRWLVGLSADRFSTKCGTVLQLAQRWNELAVSRASSTGPPKGASWTQDTPDDGKGFLEGLES